MGIYRGTGGTGDSTTDTTVTTVTEKAAEAASSATSAANSATSAANSATSAETSATNAATSETNAANSATASATSATASETAKTAAQAAQTAAETAETNAETAEANAVTAKNQAVSAKDNAVTAQTAAETAETNAETAYANTLAIYGSTTDVQNAVNSASASATTATTKAAEAASSATDASNYSSSAGTSATQAASSASQAATSAASANSYATDAQTAQTAAETAQAAAEAAEYNINGLYLGSLADDPTLDGNGVAVTTGDLYFNTTEQEVRVYTDGDVWEPVVDLAGDITVNSLTSNNDVVVKGNLEVQGTTITVDSATAQTIDLGDNDKIRLGDSDDLQIYHDGTDSYIVNTTGTLKLSGNTDVTGNITVSGTVDGRDIAADGTKLDGIEANADVTDTANVTAAGALMDSEVTNLAQVKAFDSADYATAAQGAKADSALQSSGDTLTGDLAFGDNVKATFGASDDLQIYHDGTKSYISDTGTGTLDISTNGSAIRLVQGNGNRLVTAGYGTAGVKLWYGLDDAEKLATTSSGVDVTGTLVSDGLTVNNTDALAFSSTPSDYAIIMEGAIGTGSYAHGLVFKEGSDALAGIGTYDGGTGGRQDLWFATRNASTVYAERMRIAHDGDISFYEDTGTTAKLTWDASDESLNLKDNVDLLIGDSGDLRLFHNGTSSFVYGQGAGDLHLRSNSNVILSTNTGETMVNAAINGAVTLYYDNSSKLSTTSTGIDVTGTVTADGATIDGTLSVNSNSLNLTSSSPAFRITDSDTSAYHVLSGASGYGSLYLTVDAGSSGLGGGFYIQRNANTPSVLIANSTGDISFYDDAGTSQDFYWDASTSRLGLGTTTPSTTLDVNGIVSATNVQATASVKIEANNPQFHIVESDGPADENINMRVTGGNFQIRKANDALNTFTTRLQIDGGTGDLVIFADDGTSQDFYWDASTSRLGLGTTSPAEELHISASVPKIQIQDSDGTNQYGQYYHSAGSTSILSRNGNTDGQILFQRYDGTTTAESMRIDSSGNLLVGTTSTLPGFGNTTTGHSLQSGGYVLHSRNGGTVAYMNRNSSDGTIVDFRKDGSTVGSISTSGGTTSYNTTSDYRLKENVTDLNGASDRLSQLQVKQFNLIGHDQTVDGFLAHEVQGVVPQAVTGSKDEVDAEGNPVYQSIDHSKLVPLLTAALQEALSEIDSLKNRVTELEARA